MSNASPVFVTPAPATIPAITRKAFKAANLAAIVSGKLATFPADAQVKPSDVRMDKASMQAALGGKASPQSFANGLIFAVTAHAWGQAKLERLQDGLPQFAQAALVAACQHVKAGTGIDAETLKHAVCVGLDFVLTLESRKGTVKAVVTPQTLTVPASQKEKDAAIAAEEAEEAEGQSTAKDSAPALAADTVKEGAPALADLVAMLESQGMECCKAGTLDKLGAIIADLEVRLAEAAKPVKTTRKAAAKKAA